MLKKLAYASISALETFLACLRGRGVRYIFHGSTADWEQLDHNEKNRYDQAELYDEE